MTRINDPAPPPADGVAEMMAAVVAEIDAAQAEWQAATDAADDRCFALSRANQDVPAHMAMQHREAADRVREMRDMAESAVRLLRDIQAAEWAPVPRDGMVRELLAQRAAA